MFEQLTRMFCMSKIEDFETNKSDALIQKSQNFWICTIFSRFSRIWKTKNSNEGLDFLLPRAHVHKQSKLFFFFPFFEEAVFKQRSQIVIQASFISLSKKKFPKESTYKAVFFSSRATIRDFLHLNFIFPISSAARSMSSKELELFFLRSRKLCVE